MAHLPKYEQIKKALLAELRAGVYPPGHRIPTREELIRKFGVTRTTVNQALKELVACGVLATSRRGGTVFTGKQPPLRVAFVSGLGKNVASGSASRENVVIDLLNPLLFRAAEFNLEFIDLKEFVPSTESMERYDCVAAVMPTDALMAKLASYPDKVLFVNRYGGSLNFISTNHRAAVRELAAHNIAAAGPDAQVFFLSPHRPNFVERERGAGFIDECAERELFYRICEFDFGDAEIMKTLNDLPIRRDRPMVICSPSLHVTGTLVKWARECGLVFGRDIFYSDFDNPHARQNTGAEIASAVQDFAAMGQELYRALVHWGEGKEQKYIPCQLIF